MCLAITRRTDDYTTNGFVSGIWIASIFEKISHDVIEDVLMNHRHTIGLIPPDSPELAGPIEIDFAQCVEFIHYFDIQMICRGSLPICSAAAWSSSETSGRKSSC